MVAVAWAGAALFLASLIYFAYFYLVWLGQPEAAIPRVDPAIAVLIDVLLFTVFALHHSLFARSGAKAWIARRVPRGLERALYVWVASLLFMSVCWLWQPVPGVAWQTSGPARWLLLGVQAAGVLLTIRSASRIDIWDLAGVRQARAAVSSPSPPQEPALSRVSGEPILEIGGPYRWVRHPIYFGWVLIVFAAPMMTANRLLFASISTLYLVIAIPFEERLLREEFGPAYAAYQRGVRWRLLPGVW
jgi:hypothetical protein